MNERLDLKEDNFLDDEFNFDVPNIVELDDNNEFYHGKIKRQSNSIMTDQEFADLLKDLGITDNVKPETGDRLHLSDDIEKEQELIKAKINTEYQLLNLEKAKLERDKKEFEKYKKLSEESFQSERAEFEKYKKIEKEKMYLETKKLVDSCTNLGEYLEGYNKIHDVSE